MRDSLRSNLPRSAICLTAKPAADPGGLEEAHRIAEAEALQSIEWGRPCGVGPDDLELAAAEDAKRIQRRLATYRDGLGCDGSAVALLADDERAQNDECPQDWISPARDARYARYAAAAGKGAALLPGPAQGHPLRESRAGLVRRRWLIQVGLTIAAVVLFAMAFGWRPS